MSHPLVVNRHHGDSFDVYVGRPSKWGNPFSHKDGTLAEFRVATVDEAIAQYRVWLWAQLQAGEITRQELAGLAGKRLGCWCAPSPCHAEVLVRAAEWAKESSWSA